MLSLDRTPGDLKGSRAGVSPATRILVADDEPEIRYLLSRVLREAGYLVTGVADGEAAWEALCAERYDLLVTDLEMPRLTGLELLQRMRGGRPDLPVVLISGKIPPSGSELLRVLSPGLALQKPFTMLDFLGKVRGVLASAR